VSGVQFVSEYRGSWRIAHPTREPASVNNQPRIKFADISVNNLLKDYS
jgi:hypothetical protein